MGFRRLPPRARAGLRRPKPPPGRPSVTVRTYCRPEGLRGGPSRLQGPPGAAAWRVLGAGRWLRDWLWGSMGMITATGSNLRSWSPSLVRMDGLSTRMTQKKSALARLHAARKWALRKRSGGAAFGPGARLFWVMRGLRPSGAPTKSSRGPRMTQKFRVLRRPHSLDAHHTHTHTPRDQQDRRRRDHAQGPRCARRPTDAHGRRHADTTHARPARRRLKPNTHTLATGAAEG